MGPLRGAHQNLEGLLRLLAFEEPARDIQHQRFIVRIIEGGLGIFLKGCLWFFVELMNDARGVMRVGFSNFFGGPFR